MEKAEQRARRKFLGEIRGAIHEIEEWSDKELAELQELSTRLAAKCAAQKVIRQRRDRRA